MKEDPRYESMSVKIVWESRSGTVGRSPCINARRARSGAMYCSILAGVTPSAKAPGWTGRTAFGRDALKSPVSLSFAVNASPSSYSGRSNRAESSVHTAAAVAVRPHVLSPSTSVASSFQPQRHADHGLGRAHRGRRSAFA